MTASNLTVNGTSLEVLRRGMPRLRWIAMVFIIVRTMALSKIAFSSRFVILLLRACVVDIVTSAVGVEINIIDISRLMLSYYKCWYHYQPQAWCLPAWVWV